MTDFFVLAFFKKFSFINLEITHPYKIGSCGLMEKASGFESEDCRFESCHDRYFFQNFSADLIKNVHCRILESTCYCLNATEFVCACVYSQIRINVKNDHRCLCLRIER